MSDQHSPRERVELFRKGWTRGAGSKMIPDQLKDDPDFQNGYREGRVAFNFAMQIGVSDETIEDMARLILDMTKDEFSSRCDSDGFSNSDDAIEMAAKIISVYKDAGKVWLVYLLRCADNSLYCGMTSDLGWRLAAHEKGSGSKYVRSRLPVKVVWTQLVKTKSEALKLEARIKKMKKADKEKLVTSGGLA